MSYYKICLWISTLGIEFLALMPNGIKIVTNKLNATGAFEHVLAFGLLYILLHLAYTHLGMMQKIVILFLFAIQLEAVQYFVPSRSVNIWDIVADMFGVGFIVVLWLGIRYFIRRKDNLSTCRKEGV